MVFCGFCVLSGHEKLNVQPIKPNYIIEKSSYLVFHSGLLKANKSMSYVYRYLTRYGAYLIENLQLRGVRLPNRGFFLTVGVQNFQIQTAAPAYVIAEYCADPYPEIFCLAPTYEAILVGRYEYI